MSREVAQSLSISDLLSVLNEKLGLERSKLREISLPPIFSASSLESETSRQPGSHSARCSESHPVLAEPFAASQENAARDPLSCRYLIEDEDDDANSIVPLTHVCRYWRESIISTPSDWTLISNVNEDMTAACLQRAKAAPLGITLEMPLDPSFPDIFAPHFQKTRTLTVRSISTFEELTNAFKNFPRSMLTLRSLEPVRKEGAGWARSTDPFRSFVPALKRLRLSGVPLYPSMLELGTLTEFTIKHHRFNLHLDTLLNFMEGNHSLERATLDLYFTDDLSLLNSERTSPMRNQLRYLSISSSNLNDAEALLFNIPLQRGADLHIHLSFKNEFAELSDFLPDTSAAHLSDPPSPTFLKLEHGPYPNHIMLDGPGGKLLLIEISLSEVSFVDLTVLPIANVREVRLHYREGDPDTWKPPVFHPAYFPALETLTVDCDLDVLDILSVLLSNSPPSTSLKTLGFLHCHLSEDVMKGLTEFASERRNTATSTPLHRVQIVHRDGVFPSAASIRRLREHVNIVEVRMEEGFSTDLALYHSDSRSPR
ncbi:hypothetical protein BJ322DRAFT_1210821 [Thelephora terrestris]|uniref:F-box domain-containing protein n=1 Tax=Thelephora terrestris TaxID=56493 RepID=A0A9P6HG05_9AGAM|nr:hypothetical protein BJ322DRAFT_1210821 [Thelephora terrestris]